jgi:hypothetical protein
MKNRTPKYYTTNEGGLKKKPDLYGKKRKLETEKKTNGPINRVFQEKKPKFCGRKPENGKKNFSETSSQSLLSFFFHTAS